MNIEDLKLLFDYNYWANDRVLTAAARMRKVRFVAPEELSHGSVRGTLVHILSAEWIWRKRCQEGASPAKLLAEADFPTVSSLRTFWTQEEKDMRAFLDSLSDKDAMRHVTYTTTIGVPYDQPLGQILLHVVNHGTQFRSEAAVVLSRKNKSPGDLDFIVYLRERRET